jgi:hypothetical protein
MTKTNGTDTTSGNWLDAILNTGLGVYQSYTGQTAAEEAAAAQKKQAAANTSLSDTIRNVLPWVIGGAVVLVVVLLVIRR